MTATCYSSTPIVARVYSRGRARIFPGSFLEQLCTLNPKLVLLTVAIRWIFRRPTHATEKKHHLFLTLLISGALVPHVSTKDKEVQVQPDD